MKNINGVVCCILASIVGVNSQSTIIRPLPIIRSVADILTADLGAVGAQLPPPVCNGTVDLLPVTFTFPVASMPVPEDFEVTIGTVAGEVNSTVTPACATLFPANEANELRTVLLVGNFTPGELGPIRITVVGNVSLDVDGQEVSVMGR